MTKTNYSNHKDQLDQALPSKKRVSDLSIAINSAFRDHIDQRQIGFVMFDEISAEELAAAFVAYPILVKSILALANVAARAVERDLNMTFDTYGTKISKDKAALVAGYVKPFLPKEAAIPAIMEIDRYFWTDKQMRANKGRWEKEISKELSSQSGLNYLKRRFRCGDEQFELDAAYPPKGDRITVGVDVKRIEAPRDIHKRCDEIVNKGAKFKTTYPGGKFYAVIYYPFPSQQQNIISRMNSPSIDGVFFAGENRSSIASAVSHLLGHANMQVKGEKQTKDPQE